jgi:hypothetical protein
MRGSRRRYFAWAEAEAGGTAARRHGGCGCKNGSLASHASSPAAARVGLRTEVSHLLRLGDDHAVRDVVDFGTVGVALDLGVIRPGEGELPLAPQATRGAHRACVLLGKAHEGIEPPAPQQYHDSGQKVRRAKASMRVEGPGVESS